ncbi:2-hydroxyacid dehydrogenase [Humitalea sp. 24SJ18S-53]|uniref:2-hydroxyacid dehydrogenase n=1 Tax=Humitalea sp. 24SJ18S-53 TaxID=3422307 RepID=UPI003D66E747
MTTVHHRIVLQPPVMAALHARFDQVHGPDVPLGQPGTIAVVTNGMNGLTGAQMDLMPALKIISCFAAGHENVDLAAARQRGIWVTHAPGENAETVADTTLGLMIAAMRGILPGDRAVRRGEWNAARSVIRPTLHGSRLGIVGMGKVGHAIARRAAAFGMIIAYHTRNPRPDLAWAWNASLRDMAADSDMLVLACPGGEATRHIVNADVLAALGPQGFLVNVARGSVVDTAALVTALREKTIAGAALDVMEGEPVPVPDLLTVENLVLTPHFAGRSPAAQRGQLNTLLANIEAALSGGRPPQAIG